jgi:hypothetical protein
VVGVLVDDDPCRETQGVTTALGRPHRPERRVDAAALALILPLTDFHDAILHVDDVDHFGCLELADPLIEVAAAFRASVVRLVEARLLDQPLERELLAGPCPVRSRSERSVLAWACSFCEPYSARSCSCIFASSFSVSCSSLPSALQPGELVRLQPNDLEKLRVLNRRTPGGVMRHGAHAFARAPRIAASPAGVTERGRLIPIA